MGHNCAQLAADSRTLAGGRTQNKQGGVHAALPLGASPRHQGIHLRRKIGYSRLLVSEASASLHAGQQSALSFGVRWAVSSIAGGAAAFSTRDPSNSRRHAVVWSCNNSTDAKEGSGRPGNSSAAAGMSRWSVHHAIPGHLRCNRAQLPRQARTYRSQHHRLGTFLQYQGSGR